MSGGIVEFVGRRWAPERAAERARDLRRGHAVRFYTGRNGSAKSLCAIYDLLPDLDAGVPVLSTVRLQDFRNPRPCEDSACLSVRHGKPGHLAAHPGWVPWAQEHGGGGWPQFLEFRDGVIFMDEVTGVADSHEWSAIPVQVSNEWHQLRRREVQMVLTGLDFVNVNKRIRQAVNVVTRCRSFMPVTVTDENDKARAWRQRRLAAWTTYAAETLPRDDASETAYENAQVVARSRYWIPGSLASLAYDTYENVGRIATVDDKGNCAHCGGKRTQPQCSCPDYVEQRAGSRRTARSAQREDSTPRPVALPPLPDSSPALDSLASVARGF